MADRTAFLQEVLDNFKLCSDVNAAQLRREREDLEFQVPEKQWDAAGLEARGPTVIDGVLVPGRPCLSIPKLEQPIRLITNQMAAAKLGVNIHPLDLDANDDTAAVMQDLYRTIERDSNANVARLWAFDRAVRAGRGYYRISTEYDGSTADPFDQKICIERILYQSAVGLDPTAVKADFSDAQWGYIAAWVPIKTFKRNFPDADISSSEEDISRAAMEQLPDWVRESGADASIQVIEYWQKEYSKRKLKRGDQEREIEDVVLKYYKLAPGVSGLQILEETEWNGPDIPIVIAVGNELQPFDDERRWFGVVRPARDGQKTFNYAASQLVQMVALEPQAPFIGVAGSFEGYERLWSQANTRSLAYLEWNPTDINGAPAPRPERVQVDTSRMGPSVMLMNQADSLIQSATFTPEASLGEINNRDRSGKAIRALQGQSEQSRSNYLQNFADISMKQEARIILGMMKNVYDRPGRIARLVNDQGDERSVMLNAPFEEDERGPRRVSAPTQKSKTYDLSKGIYGVSVTIGKSYQTRIEEGSEAIAEVMKSAPEMGEIVLPLWLQFQDFPGAKEMAKLAKEFRDKKFPGLGQDEQNPESPEMLKSQLQAAQQQIQEMQAQLQQASMALETDQARQRAQLQKAQIDAQARLEAAQMQAQLKANTEIHAAEAKTAEANAQAALAIRLEEMRAESAMAIERMRIDAEQQRLLIEQRFDALQAALARRDREHEKSEGKEDMD